MDDNLYLSHYGVKGQKWGVRRTKAQLGYKVSTTAKKIKNKFVKNKTKKSNNTSSKSSKKIKTNDIKKMSDEELRNRMNRIRLEQEYLRYTTPPKRISTGRKIVQKVFNDVIVPSTINAGKSALTNYLTREANNLLGTGNNTKKDSFQKLKDEVAEKSLRKQNIELDNYFKRQREDE